MSLTPPDHDALYRRLAELEALEAAVLYALKAGCFFPVPAPTSPYRVKDLIQWGAMRNLHTTIAELRTR